MDTPTAPVAPEAPVRGQLDGILDMVSSAWKWYFNHLKAMLGISSIMLAVQIVAMVLIVVLFTAVGFSALTGANGFAGMLAGGFLILIIIGVGMAILSSWMAVSIYTYILANRPEMSIKEAYQAGRPKLWSYLTTSLWVALYVCLGFILFIIPGIIWGVTYSLAPLIIVAEGSGVRALNRSKELIRGYWFPVFIRYIILGITIVILQTIFDRLFTQIGTSVGSVYSPFHAVGNFSNILSTLIVAPIELIFTYQIYQNLRRIKG